MNDFQIKALEKELATIPDKINQTKQAKDDVEKKNNDLQNQVQELKTSISEITAKMTAINQISANKNFSNNENFLTKTRQNLLNTEQNYK